MGSLFLYNFKYRKVENGNYLQLSDKGYPHSFVSTAEGDRGRLKQFWHFLSSSSNEATCFLSLSSTFHIYFPCNLSLSILKRKSSTFVRVKFVAWAMLVWSQTSPAISWSTQGHFLLDCTANILKTSGFLSA